MEPEPLATGAVLTARSRLSTGAAGRANGQRVALVGRTDQVPAELKHQLAVAWSD
jgi:hypothetical protein